MMPEEAIGSVFESHKKSLLELDGVVGVAIGKHEGRPCIRVFVARKNDELLRQIPVALDGYKISIEETGEFRALVP